jgi:hypothetical protein
MVPDRGLAKSQESGVKGKKTRIAYALTTNADGSEKLPPFMIGKVYKPRPFQPQPFFIRFSDRRHIVLLQVNFKGHDELGTVQ